MIVAANKADNRKRELEAAEFHALGWEETYPISALHGRGVADLLDVIVWALPPESESERRAQARGGGARRDGRAAPIDALDDRRRGRVRRSTTDRHAWPSSAGPTSARARCSTRCSASSARSSATSRARRATRSTPRSSGPGARSGSSTRPASSGAARSPPDRPRSATRRCARSRPCRAPTSQCSCSTPADGLTSQDAHVAGYALEEGTALVIAINKWDLVEKDAGTLRRVRGRPAPRGAVPGVRADRVDQRQDRPARRARPGGGARDRRGAPAAHADGRAQRLAARGHCAPPAGDGERQAAALLLRHPGRRSSRPRSCSSPATPRASTSGTAATSRTSCATRSASAARRCVWSSASAQREEARAEAAAPRTRPAPHSLAARAASRG